MIDNIQMGLELFFSLENFIAIFIGTMIGVTIGAIPGLSTTMAVALALPFTFALEPITGILMLIGIYKGGIFGGSVSAILVRAPGTPAAASTVLDGYPMAQNGQAGKALHMALYASVFADILSNFALIFLAGFIASFALQFGPPEYFWLIAFSLTIVISISGASMIRGLIAGLVGILLSTVGLDLVYGSQRFTYGNFNLMTGISYIPLLIGLFAIPEVIEYFVKKGDKLTVVKRDNSRLTKEEKRNAIPTILRGSFIGVALGAIPGIGATAASFLSYGVARRLSKNPENFGKGEIIGVAASESGNNGTAGATLVPLLALGVPGDVVTAVILGAFMMQGLTPGPLMFQENIDLIYALFAGMIVASGALFFSGHFAIRYFARIADVPRHILMPLVLMFCTFGSYSVQNQVFDVGVMLAFGLFGFLITRAAIPSAPLLIGFILGPLFEDNLRRSYLIASDMGIFVRSGICWFFIAATILSIYFGIRKEMAMRKSNAKPHLNAQ